MNTQSQRSQIQHKTHEFDEFNRKIMIMIASLQWNSIVGALYYKIFISIRVGSIIN